MLRRNDRNLDNIPVGALGIIALDGCKEMGGKVNNYLVKWRKEDGHAHKDDIVFHGYEPVSYTHLDVYKRQILYTASPDVMITYGSWHLLRKSRFW